ncbi:TPA: hypothetical protein OS528_005161 [Klebsiella pneumoniae]|jgi:hypothetical protein|uniref:hypothetical protein n=1 Tax=Klebsiella pneumoniae TaxID=573 RepID=UPI000808CE7C|nr:hypothetical protein [Klebsiella pneumoniae]MCS6025820.1 hypothetical protein [Klebsiella pneumoniae subsp. pneumoniae]ELB5208964.1 hypothetical protein [Klebsiella pneumoniae]EMA2443913.1 hypothetical protein [Klebsiella pneumoniae]MBA1424640.1 hypothetical protein [Klebsiella pneumoniae]MBZ1975974.1 hypothetical protein [Klebsiella pneumoniae]
MDTDSIAYASMLVSKESANWAFWSMIAAAVAALASLITSVVTGAAAVIAYKTMNTWKHQEEIKEKKILKAALVEYRNLLVAMPYLMHEGVKDREKNSLLLNDVSNKIYLPLVVLEEDLDNGELGKRFTHFFRMHFDYLSGAVTRQDLAKVLAELLGAKIIGLRI